MTTNGPVGSQLDRITAWYRAQRPQLPRLGPSTLHSAQRATPAPRPGRAGVQGWGLSRRHGHLIRSVVADAMRQLSVEDRVVIYLSYYQGWTTSRIAANLELTEAAVQSQLHTGLGALRLALREMGVPA
jgi:DNA-directed RNA polymerase specialized sigma24 family protein